MRAAAEPKTTQAGMPVLLNLRFFARRKDFLMRPSQADSVDEGWYEQW